MTVSELAERTGAPDRSDGPVRRRLPSPGWLPFLVALGGTVAVLSSYDVAAADLTKFAAYTLLAGTLPGTLIWRAVRGGAGFLPLDAAFGTVVGFVIELPVYLIARSRGVPLAVLAWPIVTLVVFAAVPPLWRFWRGSGRRLPVGVSWTVAAGMLYLMVRSMSLGFRSSAVIDPYRAGMGVDFPFQFALVGLLKHTLPLDTPWVAGTPLDYHWYVYAHGAAAGWLTGIEPEVLVLRLLPIPMVAAFLLVLVAIVHRMSGRWWAGSLAVVLTLVGTAISPYAWGDRPLDNGAIADQLWQSPTQTFAALLCAAAVYVLADLLTGERRVSLWCAYAVLAGAVAGAKATFVPMLLCGLLFAALIRFARTRRVGAEVAALAITLFWFGFAQLVLYRSGSQGMVVAPLQTVKWAPLGRDVFGVPSPTDDWPALLALAGVGTLALAYGWAGLAGLVRRDFRRQPLVHVMLGIGLSGVGGLWVFAHPGLSQAYFARSATPYLAMVSAIGLAALIPDRPRSRWFVPLAVAGALLGAAALITVQLTAGRDTPLWWGWTPWHAVWPYLLLTALVAGIAALLALIGWPARLGVRGTLAVAVVTALAAAITTGLFACRGLWPSLTAGHQQRYAESAPIMPLGAAEAGRWLRAHSDPRDVVATNSHCRFAAAGCDSRDFWLSAYAERRVVVEGWSYTEPAFESGGLWDRTLGYSPFWDPALLAANDAVFYQPTAANVAAFTRQHGVRWLVAVDTTPSTDPEVRSWLVANPDLARYAMPRFWGAGVVVYEVTGEP